MFDISREGNIQLIRGDTLSVALFINSGTPIAPERYILKETDTVYLAVMEENQKFEDAILKKVYSYQDYLDNQTEDGDLIITLQSEDTEYLEDGKYHYTVKLHSTSYDVDKVITLIPDKKFFIID